MLGKSIISAASKVADQDADAEIVKMEWPEDSIERAKLIRAKACSMTGCVEAVSSSFITGRVVKHISFPGPLVNVWAHYYENCYT